MLNAIFIALIATSVVFAAWNGTMAAVMDALGRGNEDPGLRAARAVLARMG